MTDEQTQFILQAAREGLVEFEIATDPDYRPSWHHRRIARELEHVEAFGDRDYKILIITEPPRHGKSQEASIDFPAWYMGRNPGGEIIAASYAAELAQDFGSKVRNKIGTPEYRLIFPNTVVREDEHARGRWRTTKGGSYVGVGVGGPITGRGCKILLIDDPIKNREEAESTVFRDKVWGWFTSTAFTRLAPGGVVIIILTRWHDDDLAGRVLANEHLAKRTKVVKLPAIANVDGPNRKKGEALWPERYPLSALEEIRTTVGPYDFACTPAETPILMADWTFKPISEVKVGDIVVGFKNGKGLGRSRLYPSVVKRTFSKADDVYSFSMKSGRTVKCTKDHRWYTGRIEGAEATKNYKGRKAYAPAKVGGRLMFAVCPKVDIKNEDIPLWNYLGGIIDGEGHIGKNTLAITQTSSKNGPVLARIKATMDSLGISYHETIHPKKENWEPRVDMQVRDCRSVYLKLLKGKFCAKSAQIISRLFEKSGYPIKEEDVVMGMDFERKDNVYALETETGNYIAWGYISSNSLYQCSPVTSESQEFKPEWYKYISEEELAVMQTANYLTVDTAMSKEASADYCGFCDNSVDKENFWNLRAWRARLGPAELVDALFSLHASRRYSAIGLEKTIYTDGLKPFLDAEQRKRNVFLPIVEVAHGGTAKEVRIRSLVPRYASGSVRHVDDRCDALEEELASFPSGVHDDVADAVAYQSQVAVPQKKKGAHVKRKAVAPRHNF